MPRTMPAPEPAVWLIDIAPLAYPARAQRWRAAGLVTDAELERAAGYRHPQARMQTLAGRALARHALALAARCAPSAIRIVQDEAGKPAFAATPDGLPWHFNISHSGRPW